MPVSDGGLPCPYCGGTSIQIEPNWDEVRDQPFYCWCVNCGARGPEFKNPALAKAYWNLLSIKARPADAVALQEKWIRLSLKDDREIKPCPFCGEPPKVIHKRLDNWPDHFGYFKVTCEKCHCDGPEHFLEIAIKLWNETAEHLATVSLWALKKAAEKREAAEASGKQRTSSTEWQNV